jgi:hypothetical protein
MRLWSLHPEYLDSKGLVACWREALLAKAVLEGKTKGYRNHPQLARFKRSPDALAYIDLYLRELFEEAAKRGYSFDKRKFSARARAVPMLVTRGQLVYEFAHLLGKLRARDPKRHAELQEIAKPRANPIFKVVDGGIEEWEIAVVRT